MQDLVNYLVNARKDFSLFSRTKAASESGVTEQTVRNFENGNCINPKVLLYYMNAVHKKIVELENERLHNNGLPEAKLYTLKHFNQLINATVKNLADN